MVFSSLTRQLLKFCFISMFQLNKLII